jgi:hypothetical protein
LLPDEEGLVDFRRDRKMSPSQNQNDHARLEWNDNSFRSTDSSIFSSHPTSQTQTQDSYKDCRSSLLDDAESFVGGMLESDGNTWAGFPITSSSHGVDVPAESVSATDQDDENASSFFSMDSAIHAIGSDSGRRGEETGKWNPFFDQSESSYVASPVPLSLRTKSSGESTRQTIEHCQRSILQQIPKFE